MYSTFKTIGRSVYIDTSVYGGYFDNEFMKHTRKLFDYIKQNEIVILKSFITELEMELAPLQVKQLYQSFSGTYTNVINYSDVIDHLAMEYINHKVIPPSHIADGLHVAAASIVCANSLISWDFKHILRQDRVRGFNYVNNKNGLPSIHFLSPLEALRHEN
jgi:hypothetical protein